MTLQNGYQRIEWLGTRFGVPDEWELVRHSLDGAQGSLKFIDRSGHRLTLSWADCASAPRLERLARDYESQASTQGTRFVRCSVPAPWLGLAQEAAQEAGLGRRIYRAVRFDMPTSRLIEVLLIDDPGSETPALLAGLLGSISIDARAEQATRWCAFNVAVTAAPGFALVRTAIKPADTVLEFESSEQARGPRRVTVRRRGMSRTWFGGDLARLIASEEPRVRFGRFESLRHGPHSAVLAEGLWPTKPLSRLLKRQPVRRVLAWQDEAENAIYQLATLSHPEDTLSPSTFEVVSARST